MISFASNNALSARSSARLRKGRIKDKCKIIKKKIPLGFLVTPSREKNIYVDAKKPINCAPYSLKFPSETKREKREVWNRGRKEKDASSPFFCTSLQLIQMLQPRQHNLLARLLNLARQKDFIEDGVDLVKVEDEVELADVAEEGVEDLDEEVDGLEEGELVVVCVDAGAEEEAGVAAVDDLVVAKLDEVGLVFLVARGDEAVNLALELDLFVVAVGGVPFGEAGFAPID